MQFVRGGPDIPERLLQAHEDGRVVFFCGAGISYPAGLPGFGGLTQKLFRELGIQPSAVQQAAIDGLQFDTAIGLLEGMLVGGREVTRRSVATVLTPDLSLRGAIETHDALLTLARGREGRTRLITTNFDRLFEEVIKRRSLTVERFGAPLLPVPKTRWDGLVYLHGLLTETPTTADLDRLVLSSGDFGLAYLTERWAARFVSELFRNYTVCFIGYSLNDPVLRYMMDALAADRLLGEAPPEMFAFGSYSKGMEGARANEWHAKNVTPILYREHRSHAYLHRTLRAWADTYRDGVRGKERIVAECAIARPLASTAQDDLVGRLLWALSDPQALPAKRFAEFNPVPSLDWLEPLLDERYRHADLSRFGVPPTKMLDERLTFSLLRRPSPYTHAPWMTLTRAVEASSRWDDVMHHLALWLVRHLDDQRLLMWFVKRGGDLHSHFASLVEHQLAMVTDLEKKGNTAELARMRANAPNAIPGPNMRKLWHLVLAGRARTLSTNYDVYRWLRRSAAAGPVASARMELRTILTPRVSLREPFHMSENAGTTGEVERLRDLVDWEITLSGDHLHGPLRELFTRPAWAVALPALLVDFSTLLRDAADLQRELGGADDKSDLSYLHQPSISPHPQNKDFREWTVLIDLTRDAWTATADISATTARAVAEIWWQTPYPLFKRLALFAATRREVVPDSLALEWILSETGWWLWSIETQREMLRLLVARAALLTASNMRRLEQAILVGPPRSMFKDDIEPERWNLVAEREVWLRLAKLASAGGTLSPPAETRLRELAQRHAAWQVTQDEKEEFPYWMGDGEEWRKFSPSPRAREELVEWLKTHRGRDFLQEDDWQQRCRDDFPTTATALRQLAQENVWLPDRWREALHAWSEEKLIRLSWRHMAATLQAIPAEHFEPLANAVSWWLQAIAKTFVGNEASFVELCWRILTLELDEGQDRSDDDPVGRAINHPVGHAVQALLTWWYRRQLEDNQGLSSELLGIFTAVTDTSVKRYRHGRVLLSAHVIPLFRVDPTWAVSNLLPLFDWERSEVEARASWEGFLWSPRLYRPLLEVLRTPFLDTAHRYAALGKHDAQYAALLTYAALDPGDTFNVGELAAATRALPTEGLQDVAQSLVRAIESSGQLRSSYWTNRIVPYLKSIWPRTRDHLSPAVSESIALLVVAAQEHFPEAFEMLRGWLQPLQHGDHVIDRLHEAQLPRQFPENALSFIDTVVDRKQWLPTDLRNCLEAIVKAEPGLAQDPRFQQLTAYVQRFPST